MRLLIVEDETELRQQLSHYFAEEGYVIDSAADGEEGLCIGKEHPIDVAVIDVGLPEMTGIELLQELRTMGKNFPVLLLTARGRWQDKVEGLDAGADDYLIKPFHMEELAARVKALLRRATSLVQPVIVHGPIELDAANQLVTVNGKPMEFTAYEYKVLEHLMLNADHVISKADLAEHIYSHDSERDSNVLEVFIGRLRRKIDPDNTLKPIETLRGRGYRFTIARSKA